jgi:hypothetical protein
VDEDSLNRHLSQNRQCSSADIDATDKLSILAPDPDCAKHLKSGMPPDKTIDHTHISYVNMLNHLEGNLVNVANVMGMQAMQQQVSTSLHPDPSSMTFIITLSDDFNNDGGVERELKTLDKLLTSKSVQVQIFQNDNFEESEQQTEQDVEHISVASFSSSASSQSESYVETGGESIDTPPTVTEVQDAAIDQPPPAIIDTPQAVEFDVGINEDLDEPGPDAADTGEGQLNNNIFVVAMENLPIVQNFHGGSPQLDCLAELYTMLDKCGVANSLFDKITQWAWLHGPSFG